MNAFWAKVNIGDLGTQFSVATQFWEIFLGNYKILIFLLDHRLFNQMI